MRQKLTGTNVTVFLLFFGLSLLEAFGSRNWVTAALWLAVAAFLNKAPHRRDARTQTGTAHTRCP